MICIDDDLLILYYYVYVSQTSARLGTRLYYEVGRRSCEAKTKIRLVSDTAVRQEKKSHRKGGKEGLCDTVYA
jgi:hypothetical protein